MDQWLVDLMARPDFPTDSCWEAKRRWLILARWPDPAVRAAEQDARQDQPAALARYDAEVVAIKAAVPK